MIGNKRVLAVVPARGGSKGLPHKNLREFLGVPLVSYTAKLIQEISEIDCAVVSTDDDEIAAAAEAGGLLAPFRRPPSLSGDTVGDWDVVNHALLEMERRDSMQYDLILLLQPTSPLRKVEHVRRAMNLLLEKRFDAVWTLSETDSKQHPLKQLSIHDDGTIDFFDPNGANIIARQQLGPVYHRNGVCYAFSRACIVDQLNVKGERTGALVLKENLVSIDSQLDLDFAEWIYHYERSAK